MTQFTKLCLTTNTPSGGVQWGVFLRQGYIEGKTFRLCDLLIDGEDTVRGKVIENCVVIGPAIVTIPGTTIDRCTFGGSEGSHGQLFTEIPDEPLGTIKLRDCAFRRCQFVGVGVAGTAEQLADFCKGVGIT